MPVRLRRLVAYGQVAGEVTVTFTIVAPSVTLTEELPPGTPFGPPELARVIDSVLPETTAVTLALLEFTE